ncbi:MAG TPA: ADOP family duplicated permease [Chthoniobacterales bacterium]|nr:ADOP family duplicated permease [Chthoniobacterales bacterium]
MHSLLLDAASALRFFSRRKTAFVAIVLTIGFALAANTTAFSVVHGFLFGDLAVPQSDRVVLVWTTKVLPGRGSVDFNDAFPNYRLLKETTHSFSALSTTLPTEVNWEQQEEVRHLQGARVTASFFEVMGIRPVNGRIFASAEEGPNAAPVAIISYSLWRSAFAGDPKAIGQTLRLNGGVYTIIGVLPQGFEQPTGTEIWLPFDLPQDVWTKVIGARHLTTYARLAAGVELKTANEELRRFATRATAAEPLNKDWGWRAQPLREALLSNSGTVVLFVQTGALVLLLLAICNLIAVLIAWAAERERETAVRIALGASSWRIIRQFIVQSFLLVGAAGIVAIGLTWLALPLLRSLNPSPALAFLLRYVELDWTTIGVAALLVFATAMFVGLLPALQLRSVSPEAALRSESRGGSANLSSVRWQKIMVIFQAGFSVVILVCAALAAQGLQKVSRVDLGFSDAGRIGFRIEFPEPAYATHEQRAQAARALDQNLANEPALQGHGLTTTLPVGDGQWGSSMLVRLPTGEFTSDPVVFHYRRISPGYLAAMGVPLLEGRFFDERDRSDRPPVAIVSKSLAAKYWPGQSAIGRELRRAAPDNPVTQVIGVVGDVRDAGAGEGAGETVYVPFDQVSMRRAWIVLRPRGSIADAVAAGRRALRLSAPGIAPFNIEKLETLSWQALALPRLQAALFAVFSVIAVGITALGTYGVMSQLVGIRQKELAIRAAVGASPRSLFQMVLWQNARLAVSGTVVGIATAWAASHWLQSKLTNFQAPAVMPFVAIAAGVFVLTQLASFLPARRAAYFNPQTLSS